MIAIKTILFFFALIFTIRFCVDVVLRIIGLTKTYTNEEWHYTYVRGWLNPLEFATNKIPMILTWTAFYLINQF